MSTNGILGFIINGNRKLTYNHFDSYPSGLGESIVEWTRVCDMDEARRLAEKLTMVDGCSEPTPEQIDELCIWADLTVSTRSLSDWYCLLRQTQGDPDEILNCGFAVDGSDCNYSWMYIIDFDNSVFRVLDASYRTIGEFPLDDIPVDWIDRLD